MQDGGIESPLIWYLKCTGMKNGDVILSRQKLYMYKILCRGFIINEANWNSVSIH